jgi:uncharacterized protein (TIGR00730 family)
MESICVYCGSSDKINSEYLSAAYQLGAAIASHGLELWYGAGSTGLMGAVADGALEAGGEVIGVIPVMFNTPKLAHSGLTRLEVVETIHQRKQRLADQAGAFIALPGGFGTFEELFEILTWAQIGLHHKPVGLLNVRHYFDPLLAMVDHARVEGFIYAEHRALFNYAETAERLLDLLENYSPPEKLDRWLTRDD